MPTPFTHTTRAIAAEHGRGPLLAITTGLLVLAAWAIWFFSADITVYRTSERAHLKQSNNTVQIAAQRAGKVVAVPAALGDTLKRGDVLLQLDTASFDLDLHGDTRVARSLADQLAAIDDERALLETKFTQDDNALQEQLTVQQQLHRLQTSNQQIQADVAARYEQLRAKQQGSELDYLAAKRAYQQAAMATLQAQADIRAAEDRRAQLASDYQLAVTALQQRRDAIQQQRAATDTRVQQHDLAIDQQYLRAPMAGTLAALADLREGEMVAAGAVVGTIRADGAIEVQAQFTPARALGHIHPGQPARIKLDGFSWARYGQLSARVQRVASAIQGGVVQVALVIEGEVPAGLPLQHDLPATVEIAIGNKTPYQLVLQRAGDLLQGQASNDQQVQTAGAGR